VGSVKKKMTFLAAYARLESLGTFLSIELLNTIAKKEKINLQWLITGKGDPYTLPEQIRNQTATTGRG